MTEPETSAASARDVDEDGDSDRNPTDPSGSLSQPRPPDRRPTDPSVSHSRSSMGSSSVRSALAQPSASSKRSSTTLERRRGKDPGLDDEHVGKNFDGKYRIDRLIAKGGMGRVYRATQFPPERQVAIKILNSEFQAADPNFVRRFFLEASIAANLSHPHTITVFDYGEGEGGELYIAMEYLRGRSLSRMLSKRGAFGLEDSVRIGIQIARALREAHRQGIIHRDLKPGNVFLLEGESDSVHAKVLDFGLVKLFSPSDPETGEPQGNMLGKDQDLTRTGTLLGSPKYMSPEQIQGMPLDPRTDIYSFGIILFYMITGQPPFTGATGVDVIYKHVNHPAPKVHDVNPNVECTRELEDVIRRCLAKKREDRFDSMQDIIVSLKEVLRIASGNESVSDFGPMLRQANEDSLSNSQASLREASFRENLVDEPTPTGVAPRDPNAQSYVVPPPRLPLYLAALGFFVALVTLGFVLWDQTREVAREPLPNSKNVWSKPDPKPNTPDTKAALPVEAEVDKTTNTDKPGATEPPKTVPEVDSVVEVAPDPDIEPVPEPKNTATKSRKKRRRVSKSPPKKRKTEDKPKKEDGEKLDLPPAYRDNPY